MKTEKDSTASEEKGGRSYWGFVIWPVVAVMVYVLSAGPISLAVYKNVVPARALCAYSPLRAVLGSTPLKNPFGKYLFLWSPEAFDRYWRSSLVNVPL